MKIRNILLLIGGLYVLTACDESKYELDTIVPEQYHKILYVKNSGKQRVTLYNTGEDYAYTFSVVKSGSQPTLTASADIHLLSQAELDTKYSVPEAINYQLIGTDCYSIATTHLDFSSAERYKSVTVLLNPEKVNTTILTNPNAVWVLPFHVTSENDSINSGKNELFLQIAGVITPSFGFESSAVSVQEYSYGADVSPRIVFGLDTENSWNIDCVFAKDDAYREAYNLKYKTIFQGLADNAYSFEEKMTLPSGTTKTELGVTIKADQLQPGDYMLPIRIQSVSLFEVSSRSAVHPLAIRILGPKLDRSAWTIEANTQEPGGEGAGNGVAGCTLDGNLSTYWHSSWQSGNHALPHELIIDVKTTHTFTQFGLAQRQDKNYMDTNAGAFYVSSDKVNWTKAGTFALDKVATIQNFTLETPTRGRYFKVEITQSNRGLNTSLSEIYAYGL